MFVKTIRQIGKDYSFETLYQCDLASFDREKSRLYIEKYDGTFLEINLEKIVENKGQDGQNMTIYFMNDSGKTFDTYWLNYE